MDLSANKITRDGDTLYNDKSVNPLRTHRNSIYIHMHQKTKTRYKIHEAKSNRIERIDKSTTVVQDFKTLISKIDGTTGQKISKNKGQLKTTINQ